MTDFVLTADSGSFSLAGETTTINTIIAGTGTFGLTGSNTILVAGGSGWISLRGWQTYRVQRMGRFMNRRGG